MYQIIYPAVFHNDIFEVFAFRCHGNQNSSWNGNLLANLKGDHPRIIPVKFGEILRSGLGRRCCLKKLLTEDGHPMVIKIVSIIRKDHNHKLQTNPWHHEEEPHNNHMAHVS